MHTRKKAESPQATMFTGCTGIFSSQNCQRWDYTTSADFWQAPFHREKYDMNHKINLRKLPIRKIPLKALAQEWVNNIGPSCGEFA
jgi:hypothetical protein